MWVWNFAPPAQKEFLTLPAAAKKALVAFMQEVIGDDPSGIRQEAARVDPGGVVRDLEFGGGEGVVSVLIHVRGEQVMVTKILWLGA